jgi:hypothetical protein
MSATKVIATIHSLSALPAIIILNWKEWEKHFSLFALASEIKYL